VRAAAKGKGKGPIDTEPPALGCDTYGIYKLYASVV
jgi:hypothetical protein